MRIIEVIGQYVNEEPPAKPSLSPEPILDIARQNQYLLALLHQALMRDGRVIAPFVIGSDFERSEDGPKEDDDWLSGSLNRVNGIANRF
jgi:hypothetical protein